VRPFIGGRHHGCFDFEKEASTRLDHIALVLQGQLFGHPTPGEIEIWWKGRLTDLEEQEADFRNRRPE
jgi:hypothetical protein